MNNRPHKTFPPLTAIFYLLAALFVLSIFWINFHNAIWYQTDVYTYALEGKLMHEARSCFPEGWIFGNQYHIISSPNLSALFYGLVRNSTTSMGIASSLSTLIILASFFWCFYKYIGKTEMALGLLCIGGGIIFGTRASTYISGLQVLYTMASFYASYLVVLLLSLGYWLRLKNHSRPSPWVLLLILPLNFAAGMQSLREMLVLVIPLLVIEGFLFLLKLAKGASFKDLIVKNAGLFFVLGLFLVQLCGHFYMKSLDVNSTPIIGDVGLDFSVSHLAAYLWSSTKNLLRISGLAISIDGLRYLPLSVCALVIVCSVIWSILHIFRTKDDSPLATAIIFSAISVFGIFFVGVFLMRTRDIYYFVYWLLAALSAVYLFRQLGEKMRIAWGVVVAVICVVNYGFNFIPDFKDYKANNKKITHFVERLAEQGVKVIYLGSTSPIIAACSDDRILSQAVWMDVNLQSGYPMVVFPSDKYVPAFDDDHYKDALICLSGPYLDYIFHSSDASAQELASKLVYYDELVWGNRKYVLYRPVDRVIAPITYPYSYPYHEMD